MYIKILILWNDYKTNILFFFFFWKTIFFFITLNIIIIINMYYFVMGIQIENCVNNLRVTSLSIGRRVVLCLSVCFY